jgi:hypothetical protein
MTSVQWICAGSVLDRRLPDRFSSPLRPSAQVSMVTKTTCLSGEKNVLVWPIPAKGKRTQGINPQRSAPSLGYQLPSAASPTRHGFLCTHLHFPRRPALPRRLADTPHHFPNYPASRPHYLSDPADSLPLKPPPLPPLFPCPLPRPHQSVPCLRLLPLPPAGVARSGRPGTFSSLVSSQRLEG